MEWDLKMPPWDITELARDAEPSLGSLLSPSSGLARQTSALDCSVDLKLGGLGDFGPSSKWKDQTAVSLSMVSPSSSSAMVSPSGPAKRARAPGTGVQQVSCLVDGCTSDLSNCREYHRRHKVCEVHSKTPIVMVNGREQRFCQQCSRFHSLVEFDEVKRSCRKRLDGHNRRRRKPQPDTVNMGSLFASHQGSRFSTYSQIFPTATPEPNWAAVVKTEEDGLYGQNSLCFIERQEHFPGSFSHGYKEGKRFAFLQESGSAFSNRAIETSVRPPLLNSITSSESSSNRMFPNGLTQVPDSDCALSLLSSPTQTSGINLDHMLPADRIPVGQPLVSSLQQYGGLSRYSRSHTSNNVSPTGFSCSGIEDAQAGAVMVSDASDVGLHYQGMFHVGDDGPSDGPSQAIPFSW